jgi:hypothetical protein
MVLGEAVSLDVYTMTWNEEYMLPYFLRHYEQFADRIFVIDDESTDATRDIAAAHPKVEVLPCPFSGLQEILKARTFSRIYRGISRGVADWVIVVDCDEFIYHPRLLEVLAEQKATGAHIIKPDRGWMLGARETPQTTGQLYDSCTLGFPKRAYAKPVIFNPSADVWFTPGQHFVRSQGAQVAHGTGIQLLHCCYLSRPWIIDHLQRRWSRMPPHEEKRISDAGMTMEIAKVSALQAYASMKPWSMSCV